MGLGSGHVLGWSVTSEQMQLGSAVSSRLYGLAVSKSGFESLKAQLSSNVVGPQVCLPNEGPFPCMSLPGMGCRQSTAQGDAQDTAHGEGGSRLPKVRFVFVPQGEIWLFPGKSPSELKRIRTRCGASAHSPWSGCPRRAFSSSELL